MKRRSALQLFAILAASLLVGCGEKPVVPTGGIAVHYLLPPDLDPFEGAATYRVTLLENDAAVRVWSFDTAAEVQFEVDLVGPTYRLMLETLDGAGDTRSVGRTELFELQHDRAVDLSMYISPADSFTLVEEPNLGDPDDAFSEKVKAGSSALRLGDGTVLIAGGLGELATTTSDAFLYDPLTDDLQLITDSEGDHSFAAAAILGPGTALIAAGGADDVPSDEVDLYTEGSWISAPRIAVARYEPVLLPIAEGEVVIAGGLDVTGAGVLVTERIRAAQGATLVTLGPELPQARVGASRMVGPLGPVVLGGWNPDAPSQFYADGLQLDGASLDLLAGALIAGTAWTADVALPDGSLLRIGGQAEAGMDDRIERVTLTGSGLAGEEVATLPTAHRHGGAGLVFGGRILYVGGDTCDGTVFPSPCLGGRLVPNAEDTAVLISATDDFSQFDVETLAETPGPTTYATVIPLDDGTALVVTDDAVTRFNPAPRGNERIGN